MKPCASCEGSGFTGGVPCGDCYGSGFAMTHHQQQPIFEARDEPERRPLILVKALIVLAVVAILLYAT